MEQGVLSQAVRVVENSHQVPAKGRVKVTNLRMTPTANQVTALPTVQVMNLPISRVMNPQQVKEGMLTKKVKRVQTPFPKI